MSNHELRFVQTSHDWRGEGHPAPNHRAICVCGWRGPWREYASEARADQAIHTAEHQEADDGSQ
jgi:hypothetical protein